MKIRKYLGAGLVAVSAVTSAAWGQQIPKHEPGDVPGPIDNLQDLQDTGRMIFKMADANNDGQISQQEAVNAGNLFVGGFFFNADKNGDGILSQDEAKQAREEFLNQKPWLRYVIETVRTTPKANTAPGASNPATPDQNPLASVAKAFDTNNDNQLQATELRQAVQTTIQGLFATADTNRDNQLSQSEVNAGMAGVARTVAQAAFQQADTDNNGQISQAEFEKAIIEPARVAFRVFDLNHDGQISQQEAQTARQVVMSKARLLNLGEAPNSPRNAINAALGNQTQPGAAPAAAPATPAPPATPGVPR